MKKQKYKEHESREKGRVTAEKIGRYDKKLDTVIDIYLAQFEIVTYNDATGNVTNSSFVCISDKDTESGLAEFKCEMEAIKFAMNYRDNLNLG
jgi:hypothetical protein